MATKTTEVTFTATDSLSGFAAAGCKTGTSSSSTEGNPVVGAALPSRMWPATSAAAGAATHSLKIDKTAPVASASAISNGSAYTAGTWTKHDVVVSYDCTDALSGPTGDPANDTVSTESATGSASGTCTDNAGNSATATFSPIKIDKTAPVASVSAISNGSAYTAGTWTKHDVVVSYDCTDALSGPTGDPANDTVSTESATGSASGTCTDNAGNSATATFSPIKIDKTAPVASASAISNGSAYTAGTWTKHDVVVSYDCTDALSGPTGDPANDTVSTESATGSRRGRVP